MTADHNKSIRGCARYWGKHVKTAWEFKEALASVLAALAFVLGSILIGLQVLGLLPGAWPDSHFALFAEAVVALWGLAYFLLWLPYCAQADSRLEIARLQGAINSAEAARQEERRPRLEVACSNAISGCSHTAAPSMRHYFRARITLRCHQAVSGCFAKLMSIRRIDGNLVLRDHEVDDLPFAPSADSDALRKTLIPDVPIFLDILVVDIRSGVNRVHIASERDGIEPATSANGSYVFGFPATFELTVAMGGIGIPTQTMHFQFRWDGNHKTSELKLGD